MASKFLTTKATDKIVRLITKFAGGEGRPSPVPQRFTQAGWIFCSFAPRLAPFGGRSSSSPKLLQTVVFQNSKSLFGPIHYRGLRQPILKPSIRPKAAVDKPGKIPSQFTNMDRYQYIVKPILFTAFVGAASIIGCTIWQYEEFRKSREINGRFSLTSLRDAVLGTTTESTSSSVSQHELYKRVEAWWNSLNPSEKIFWPIFAINSAVWLAWRIPGWAPTMVTYFSATPVGRVVCLPMVLSMFSHYSFLHLAANMFVLHSFTPAAAQVLGKEQFVAMYLTSGTIASLGSHLHKLFMGNATPSLGASGAIMGILGLVCSRMPEIQLGIIFLPGVQFTADTALKCILAIDSAGVVLGWKFLDHAAHLSGCLFGVAFSHWGMDAYWKFRDYIMVKWHKYRVSSS